MILHFHSLLKLARAAPFDTAYRSVLGRGLLNPVTGSKDGSWLGCKSISQSLLSYLMLLRRILNALPCSLASLIISLHQIVSMILRLAKALHLVKIIRVQ
jgi:hypothetical protein